MTAKARALLNNITRQGSPLAPYAGAFFIACFLMCGIVQKTGGNIMHDLKDRLKEPSSYIGLGLVIDGIGRLLSKDYNQGVVNIVLVMIGIFKAENTPK